MKILGTYHSSLKEKNQVGEIGLTQKYLKKFFLENPTLSREQPNSVLLEAVPKEPSDNENQQKPHALAISHQEYEMFRKNEYYRYFLAVKRLIQRGGFNPVQAEPNYSSKMFQTSFNLIRFLGLDNLDQPDIKIDLDMLANHLASLKGKVSPGYITDGVLFLRSIRGKTASISALREIVYGTFYKRTGIILDNSKKLGGRLLITGNGHAYNIQKMESGHEVSFTKPLDNQSVYSYQVVKDCYQSHKEIVEEIATAFKNRYKEI